MKKKSKTILKNVLINAGANDFRLVDIYFSSQVEKIKYRGNSVFTWEDIRKLRDRKKFFSKIPAEKYPPRHKIIDGDYLFLMPGGIDPHVHFNTPGYENREDFEHGSFAAVAGGTTTVIDMPCTSVPPVVSRENLLFKLETLKGRSYSDYALWGGVAGNYLENGGMRKNVKELSDSGVAGFKVYTLSSMPTFRELPYDQIEELAKIMSDIGKPIGVHAEDKHMVDYRRERAFRMNEYKWQSFCGAHDDQAELEAVMQVDRIARKIRTPFHFVHLSSELSLKQLKRAAIKKPLLTAETCAHYLGFTENDFNNPGIRNFLKTTPPVKKSRDRDALWNAVDEGLIIFVTSDHAGCNPKKEKVSRNFWNVYAGIPGVEHRIPFMLSEGFIKGRTTLEKVIKLTAENPAGYFNLKRKGFVEKGYDADFSLINLWKSEKITPGKMRSKGKYTPFMNQRFDATVERTYLRGELVYDKEMGPGSVAKTGEFVPV